MDIRALRDDVEKAKVIEYGTLWSSLPTLHMLFLWTSWQTGHCCVPVLLYIRKKKKKKWLQTFAKWSINQYVIHSGVIILLLKYTRAPKYSGQVYVKMSNHSLYWGYMKLFFFQNSISNSAYLKITFTTFHQAMHLPLEFQDSTQERYK